MIEEAVIQWVGVWADPGCMPVEIDDILEIELGLDSLDIIELGMEIEDHFDIHIPDTDMNKWRTVQDVVNSVIKLLEEV